ncbi:MAG: ATP-binding protein [Lachnospiraceae bacterium]|nr:ATP-binding protein [Lachnospiraceae bacterium]
MEHIIPDFEQRSSGSVEVSEVTSELTLRAISSADFIIRTKAIRSLEEQMMMWLSISACGAIIYGRARIGKTRAMLSVASDIRNRYGAGFPVIIWEITDHAVTEKHFYTSLLMAMGIEGIPRSQTALALKQRVLNELVMAACQTPFRRAVLMLDEAWKFTEKDFSWLMDLYNILSRKDVLLTCFLFGTRELKDIKTGFKRLGKDQIVGRFMINEFQFYGMKEPEELMLCMLDFDKATVTVECGGHSSVPIIDYYFPDRGDRTFYGIGGEYWEAFMHIRSEYGIKAEDIPMKYLIDSFILILRRHGRFGEDKVCFPGAREIERCIRDSGYGESDDEYELSKNSVKPGKYRRK